MNRDQNLMRSQPDDPRPFLSIIAWPSGATRRSFSDGLSSLIDIDAATLYLRLGQAPPSIVGQISPSIVHSVILSIQRAGGDAFASSFAALRALGSAMRVRRMKIAEEQLQLELWEGLQTEVPFEHVRLLILGMLRDSMKQTLDNRSQTSASSRSFLSGQVSASGALMGAAGLALRSATRYTAELPSTNTVRDIRIRNKLHIHDARGGIYEIEGRRFDFSVLGDMKQFTGQRNMESLCELLSHLAPDEIVDPYFPLWKPPPGYQRLRMPGEMNHADRSFAFYSRWAALMYQHILGDCVP